ncbi:MAG TPA: hypothetical protein VE777_15875 [Gaiellales bacterium]|jgi:hypothetical protein|nr:hypothetical protein [Gaiellales bacterium]
MEPQRRRPRPVGEPAADEDLRAFFKDRAEHADTAPLTAEEFIRIAGELEIAYRLAWLKRQTLPPAASIGDRPPPR